METRREVLSGLVGACVGVLCWTVGSAVVDEVRTADVRYVVVRNDTERRQSVDVLFERDGEPVFWETYELDPGEAVEFDGFERAGEYQVAARWNGVTPSRQLETGRRAVAVVLAEPFGEDEVLIRDVPLSSLSASQRSVERTGDDAAE